MIVGIFVRDAWTDKDVVCRSVIKNVWLKSNGSLSGDYSRYAITSEKFTGQSPKTIKTFFGGIIYEH